MPKLWCLVLLVPLFQMLPSRTFAAEPLPSLLSSLDREPKLRKSAVTELRKLDRGVVLAALKARVEDNSLTADQRFWALDTTYRLEPKPAEVLDWYLKLVESEKESRLASAAAFFVAGIDGGVAKLLESLNGEGQIRKWSALGLGMLRGEHREVVPALTALATDPDEEVRVAAVLSLVRLKQDVSAYADVLVEGLAQKESIFREDAQRMLAERTDALDEKQINRLVQLLVKPCEETAYGAFKILQEVGDPAFVPVKEAYMHAKKQELPEAGCPLDQIWTILALGAIAKKSPEALKMLKAEALSLEALRDHEDPRRARVARVLSTLVKDGLAYVNDTYCVYPFCGTFALRRDIQAPK